MSPRIASMRSRKPEVVGTLRVPKVVGTLRVPSLSCDSPDADVSVTSFVTRHKPHARERLNLPKLRPLLVT